MKFSVFYDRINENVYKGGCDFMHKNLDAAFNNMINLLKSDCRCKGGWHYGSVSRGTHDEYSDYDPVFLVSDADFKAFDEDIPKIIANSCDELLIFWGESFNDDCFKNYCSIIKQGDSLHQLDFFVINEGHPEAWMCRQHCKGCSTDNIIFDRIGDTVNFLNKGYTTDNYIPDTIRAIDTYWFHVQMLVKYFKRNDIFKLKKNIDDFLFHSHVDLLLSYYDNINWGSWESKVKECVPKEKQEHLNEYFITSEIDDIANKIKKAIYLFKKDSEEICRKKNLTYSENISAQIINYFVNEM